MDESKPIAPDILSDEDISLLPLLREDMSPDRRREVIRDVAKKTVALSDRLGLVQAEILWEIKEYEYWKSWAYINEEGHGKKYSSWADYCETELLFSLRKADYIVKIYDKCVVELGIPKERLKSLQWSKVKEILDFLEPDNWEEYLKIIESKTVREVEALVKQMRMLAKGDEKMDTAGEDITESMTFRFTEEQKATVEEALKIASNVSGSDKQSHNLEQICIDFITSNPKGSEGLMTNLALLLHRIEQVFSVKVSVDELGV